MRPDLERVILGVDAEGIEAEGLVVSNIINFNEMLARTAGDLGRRGAPFAAVEIVQFCSSVIAWQLIEESAAQVALCPLSISVQVRHGRPGQVVLAWREPLASSAVVTEIDRVYEGDAFAPHLGTDWREVQREAHTAASGMGYAFVIYQNTRQP